MASFDFSLSGKWLFHLGDFPKKQKLPAGEYQFAAKTGGALKALEGFGNPAAWREVCVPHDWLTELPYDAQEDASKGCKPRDMAWYKKRFFVPDGDVASAELVFDGVLGEGTVFVNGVIVKRNFSGYNRFSAEIADYLMPNAENEIAVFVDARRHEGWWYEGAGIYRPVRILFREDSRILREECFIRSEGDSVVGDVCFAGEGEILATLADSEGREVAATHITGKEHVHLALALDAPMHWSPEMPYLYHLSVSLVKDGQVYDRAEFPVGLREICWTPSGMTLNGTPYRIKGICAHQDHAGLGAAVPADVEEYRIVRLKSLGANAYRCAHHAPSETLLDACDRLGMLVMVENRHFDVSEDTLAQLDALVRLSRNHPCVFLYCMFNEEPWQQELRGKRIVAKMRERVRLLDTTRAVTGAQDGGVLSHQNASEALDVIGINYNLNAYEECHTLYPEKWILGTENSPTFATRGVAHTDRSAQIFADDGSEYPAIFSQPLPETMEAVQAPFVAGCFVWSGFDHGGEPNPFEYPSVASHWGFLDRCGFDKNIANWLRAYFLDEPFLRLAAFAEREERVLAFTNAESAELFVDGVSFGEVKAKEHRVEWMVTGDYNELRLVAKKNGRELSDSYVTPGQKAMLSVTDVTPPSDHASVRILNVCITDANGVPLLSENGMLYIGGEVFGVGNGDPNGHHDDKASAIRLFGGMAQVITSRTGKVTLSYEGVASVTVKEEL